MPLPSLHISSTGGSRGTSLSSVELPRTSVSVVFRRDLQLACHGTKYV